jgi:hypothetical protein
LIRRGSDRPRILTEKRRTTEERLFQLAQEIATMGAVPDTRLDPEDVEISGRDPEWDRPEVHLYEDFIGRGQTLWMIQIGSQKPQPLAYPPWESTPKELVELANDAYSLDLTLDDVTITDVMGKRVATRL